MTELTRFESRLYVVALLALIYAGTWHFVARSPAAPAQASSVRAAPRIELQPRPMRRARTRSS